MQQNNSNESVKIRDASKYKIGIVVSMYYEDITGRLLAGALDTLRKWKVAEKNITVARVPGSFEISYGCLSLLKKKKVDAVVTLGCIIKGETDHDRYIADSIVQSISGLMIKYETPISFGIVTVSNMEQAVVRSTGKNNKGIEAATAALEMAFLKK